MSAESALALATGTPVATATTTVTDQSPGLAAPPKATGVDSTRFTHLAAKEAALVKQREEFKREREALEAEKIKLKPAYDEWQKFNELKEKDKIAAIKSMGFSDTDILNAFALAEDTSTPEEKAAKAAQAKIDEWENAQKQKLDADKAEMNKRVLQKFDQDIVAHVTADKDKYEYINFNGAIAQRLIRDTVSNILMEDLKTNPQAVPISIQEAAELVEKFYEDEDKRMAAIKKRTPAAPVTEAPVKDEPLRAEVSPRPAPARTLTNKTNATVASTVTRKETPREKRERLIRQLGEMGKR